MIFLVQFGMNKPFVVFEKIYSCFSIPNCTRNHVIIYSYFIIIDTFSEIGENHAPNIMARNEIYQPQLHLCPYCVYMFLRKNLSNEW